MVYQEEIRREIANDETFIEAVFKGARKGHNLPWERVVVRPVLLKNGRFFQFSYFDNQKHIAKNYAGAEVAQKLTELLELPFRSIQVKSSRGRFLIQFSKKGKAIIHREKVEAPIPLPDMTHDREKKLILSASEPVPFLQKVGIMTQNGRVKASMRRKFRQINTFLQLIDQTIAADLESPVRVVDFGCGNAYLTLAMYHYLHNIRHMNTEMVGIDIKSDLMQRHNQTAQSLGWPGLQFKPMSIEKYSPELPPHIVLALHACDTATDDALAQGILHKSHYIFAAPCCHHHLQAQLHQHEPAEPFAPVMRHGILKERLGDILTDSFRALILRLMGYQTDVIEFIATEHTPRNLMIRAVKSSSPGEAQFVEEYQALKSFWQVTPYLESLLQSELSPWL